MVLARRVLLSALAAYVLVGLWPPAAQAGCNNESFSIFFHRFVSDRTFQLERIRYPLPVRIGAGGEAAGTEPRYERWSKETVASDNLILDPAGRIAEGIEEAITRVSRDRIRVNHVRPESDSYVLEYEFRNFSGCWYLVRFADVSL